MSITTNKTIPAARMRQFNQMVDRWLEEGPIKLDENTTCTVIETTGSVGSGTSSSVTAGSGSVSSSTTVDGKTTTMQSGGGTNSSSAAASVTTGTSGPQPFSTASITRPDGSVVTRRSDGACDITKPQQ